MLEVVESIDRFKFDPENFDESSFDELYRKCRRYYLIPEEKEKLQKQCKAVFSQAETIQSKLQQILQVENVNIQKLNGLLSGMKNGKVRYVNFIDENIRNLKASLELTRDHLDKGDFPAASLCFNQLKSKMSKDLEALNDVRKAMDDANNHIVTILH
jgi:hypothetical protein